MRVRIAGPWRRAVAVVAAGCLATVGVAGCSADDDITHNPPGANARVGSVLIRYGHIAEPTDGPWERGDDAPFYAWLFDQGQQPDRLLGAETTAAQSVDIVSADGTVRGPVEVPTGRLVELKKGNPHLLLRGLRQEIRAGDYVWITLRFERAGEIALQAHAQLPTYVDREATQEPGLTSPSPGG
ncbi:copper chaperone PCu(A)C [Streptomyces sp. bgisy159]|uniref:copper chaperone PCu(A)C n=1 Tax=Streptomyces sp. bgisy159 TaxID=3413795 RepID=UPI003F4A1339